MKKKVIVTGGAGFIGSHLVDKLVNQKYDVLVIDNLVNGQIKNLSKSYKKIKFIKADIRNFKKIEKYFKGCCYCFSFSCSCRYCTKHQRT